MNEEKRSEMRKKEKLQRKQKNQKILLVAVIGFIAIISVVVAISMSTNSTDNSQKPDPSLPSDVISGTEVSIPLSEIGLDAKFYTYDSEGVEIKYFAVKGTDGEIHVAFDACDVCYNALKGYRQIGEVMHCINCGREFAINGIGSDNTAGGCWPSFLPIIIDDENVIIQISDLEEKRYMFG